MLTSYLKYLSLLIFSGLILTFFSVAITFETTKVAPKTITKSEAFSLLNDIILPLFAVLKATELTQPNN